MKTQSPRRIVVWADGSPEAAFATEWAHRHALLRSLPLHVLERTRATVAAGTGRSTVHGRDDLDAAAPGDLLVTPARAYRDLAARLGPNAATVVIVPGQYEPDAGRRRILLLAGPRLALAAAEFAFAAAADLGSPVEVVGIAPQTGTFGDDYWIPSARTTYLTEPCVPRELAKLRAGFPRVRTSTSVLRMQPWLTLRSMARSAGLAVLGAGADSDRHLDTLLEYGTCPVAVVPAVGP